MDSLLEGINNYEDKTPRELIEKNGSKDIFKLIKRGYRFDDEVLKEANILKEIRDEHVVNEFVPRRNNTPKKEFKKDTAKYEEILESLSYIEVDDEEQKSEEEEDMEEFFEHDDE